MGAVSTVGVQVYSRLLYREGAKRRCTWLHGQCATAVHCAVTSARLHEDKHLMCKVLPIAGCTLGTA